MNEHFTKQIEQVIQNYENKFLRNNMSVKRGKDIIEIRGIIKNELESNGVSACIISIKDYLKKIRTGQWIFKTGRSRLRDNLNNVLSYYENPISQSLLQYVSAVKYQLDTTTHKIEELEKQNTTGDPVKQNEETNEWVTEIQKLQEENKYLRLKNHELSQKLIESKRSTHNQLLPSSPQKAQGDDGVCHLPKAVNA